MPLVDRTEDPVIRLLVHETRLAATAGPRLAEAHRRVGAQLAADALPAAQLEPIAIDHVAGPSRGEQLPAERAPVILPLMRAGLFLAEGLWSAIPGAALHPWSGHAEQLDGVPFADRPVVVVDSVINRGTSMIEALAALDRPEHAVTVVALTANRDGLSRVRDRFPESRFVVARISDRSYVGRGATDTGSRLFGTTTWRL